MKKTIIITGSAGNLGQAVVKKFLDADYSVFATVHKNPSDSPYRSAALHLSELDLLDADACQKWVGEVISANAAIDVAVLTAGGFAMGDIATTQTADIIQQFHLNFETAYNIARPVFLQMMKQNRGKIFLVGSRAGLDPSASKGVTAYALTKSLIFRMAELMNHEAAHTAVTVSVITPSIIDTPSNRRSMPDADFSSWVTPSQIADILFFYSGEEATVIRQPVIKIYNRS